MPAKLVPLPRAPAGTPAPAPTPARLVDLSDEDVMLLVRGGSREAMAALAARYIGRLTSFCAKRTGDAAAGEDVVQEVLLNVWRRRAEWQPRGRVKALLYTAAHNLCKNRLRGARRLGHWLSPAPLDPDAHADAHDPGAQGGDLEAMLARERVRDVLRAMGELPEPMREALLLRFDAEMSYEEIAAIVGAPESTVRSRVHHALLRMRASVQREEP
jgi:RNA polymerase sigma-70 factor (ECF subfamily)